MSSIRSTWVAAVAAGVASLAAAGLAIAEAPTDTTISVSPRTAVAAPQRSPFAFPGVPDVAEGRPLPAGYVAIARDVSISRGGGETAFAAMRMTCPKGRTWRTGGASGEISVSVLDRRAAGKRSVLVLASAAPQVAAGETATGTIHALCR
jgi:putative intracellular protease/amidase